MELREGGCPFSRADIRIVPRSSSFFLLLTSSNFPDMLPVRLEPNDFFLIICLDTHMPGEVY